MIAPKGAKKEEINYSSWRLIKDILGLIRPYRLRFWLASLIRLAGDLAWLYPAFAFASIVTFLTRYRSGDSLNLLWLLIALSFAAIIIRTLSQFFSKYLGYRIAEKLGIDTILKTVGHMFRLDMIWHERENSGNKIKKIQNAGDGFNKILRIWFNNIIEISVNLVAMNIIIWRFDHNVLLVLLVFLITFFVISSVMKRRAGLASYRVNEQEEAVNGLLFETMNNIRTVKAMSMTKTLYQTLCDSVAELYQKLGTRIFWYQSRGSFLLFWAASFRLGIIILIIKKILNGQLDAGFLILFNGYFSELRASIDELSTSSIDFATAKISIARMTAILNEPAKIDDETGKAPLGAGWRKIKVKNLSFAYGRKKVLDNISFEVNRGQKIGIVGLSGAGKSTLFKLLLKEREEFSGDILFDDISLKKIRKDDFYKQISVVLQDTEVFNFSLKDNITIANAGEKANQQLLKRALATAHLAELVKKLPQGLDTLIGEKGVKLSGGERQRLGLARAIFKQPKILLLDEATSHLDLESEEKIRDSLHEFFENVTAIVIAHRLTTIREMDKILVIEKGRLIESGNFQELYNKRGRFHELWEKQKL